MTRNPSSSASKELANLPNVKLFQGDYTNEAALHSIFKEAYGAFVNTNGFNLGEKSEIYWGIRIFEIAIEEGVKHYVWGSLDYALKKGKWNGKYHCGHYDAKGRVAGKIQISKL